MSNLTYVEKRKFEQFLGMSTGYVLDFSNRTFAEFVRDSTGRDIYDSSYDYASGSKANRLRAFWQKEPNPVVAKLMGDMLDYADGTGELPDILPSRAGQVKKDPMMSAALLYNAFRREGGIIGGDAFNSVITRGLGLPLNEDDLSYNDFPDLEGEVGNIALHALDLYSSVLQAEYPTTQFTQLMALLEFLADPTDYTKSHEVGKIIGRYVAANAAEYEQFKTRYYELSGKKDDATGAYIGYRTRIVHMGIRLESILAAGPRNQLLKELDGYVRTVIDHMLERSSWSYDSYLMHREVMKPFLK